VPDATPSSPLVEAGAEAGAAGAGAGAGADVAALWLVESPMTDSEVPLIVTGSLTSRRAWVPESSPSSPVVSAACATVAPSSVMPPARSVPRRARLMNVPMIVSPLD
jgi:hypothetical protein